MARSLLGGFIRVRRLERLAGARIDGPADDEGHGSALHEDDVLFVFQQVVNQDRAGPDSRSGSDGSAEPGPAAVTVIPAVDLRTQAHHGAGARSHGARDARILEGVLLVLATTLDGSFIVAGGFGARPGIHVVKPRGEGQLDVIRW